MFSLAKAERLWQRLIGSNTPYSKDLAAQTKKLVDAGYSYDEALRLVKKAWDARASKYVPSKAGTAVGALLGL
jgi:SOS response regulatory protein OraA/RecX